MNNYRFYYTKPIRLQVRLVMQTVISANTMADAYKVFQRKHPGCKIVQCVQEIK